MVVRCRTNLFTANVAFMLPIRTFHRSILRCICEHDTIQPDTHLEYIIWAHGRVEMPTKCLCIYSSPSVLVVYSDVANNSHDLRLVCVCTKINSNSHSHILPKRRRRRSQLLMRVNKCHKHFQASFLNGNTLKRLCAWIKQTDICAPKRKSRERKTERETETECKRENKNSCQTINSCLI